MKIFFFFLIIPLSLYAQPDDSVIIISDSVNLLIPTTECDIDFTDGRSLKKVRIKGVYDTSFTVMKDQSVLRTFPINNITKITFEKNGFWTGFGIGTGSTLALGAILAIANHKGSGEDYSGFFFLYGAIACLPVGFFSGLVTAILTENNVYNFPGSNTEAKIRRLKYIIYKEKDN